MLISTQGFKGVQPLYSLLPKGGRTAQGRGLRNGVGQKKGKFIMNNSNTKPQITSGTIARTVILILALVNQVLTATGHSVINISDENVNTLISTGFTIVSAIIAWWKNNSFTQSAIKADALMREDKTR